MLTRTRRNWQPWQWIGSAALALLTAAPYVAAGGGDMDSPLNLPCMLTNVGSNIPAMAPDSGANVDKPLVPVVLPGGTLTVGNIDLSRAMVRVSGVEFVAMPTNSPTQGVQPAVVKVGADQKAAVASGNHAVELQGKCVLEGVKNVTLQPGAKPAPMVVYLAIGTPEMQSDKLATVDRLLLLPLDPTGVDLSGIASALAINPEFAGKAARIGILSTVADVTTGELKSHVYADVFVKLRNLGRYVINTDGQDL